MARWQRNLNAAKPQSGEQGTEGKQMMSNDKMLHGFVPDPLVENDASPCEICGLMFDKHSDYALYVKETAKERSALEQRVADAEAEAQRYREALEALRSMASSNGQDLYVEIADDALADAAETGA